MLNGFASSDTEAGPWDSLPSIVRRVGSDRAAKAKSRRASLSTDLTIVMGRRLSRQLSGCLTLQRHRIGYPPAMTIQPTETILIVDFGSQVTQLIARRVREAGVYCEIAPFNAAAEAFQRLQPKGIILSGGP